MYRLKPLLSFIQYRCACLVDFYKKKKKKKKKEEKKREDWKELDYREKSDRIICYRAVFERITSSMELFSFLFLDFFMPSYRIDIDYLE